MCGRSRGEHGKQLEAEARLGPVHSVQACQGWKRDILHQIQFWHRSRPVIHPPLVHLQLVIVCKYYLNFNLLFLSELVLPCPGSTPASLLLSSLLLCAASSLQRVLLRPTARAAILELQPLSSAVSIYSPSAKNAANSASHSTRCASASPAVPPTPSLDTTFARLYATCSHIRRQGRQGSSDG